MGWMEAGSANGVVEGLYEAALQPEALPDALRALAEHVDAHTSLLILTEPGGTSGFLSRDSDPRLVSKKSMKQAPGNPWTRAARRQPPETLLLTDRLVSTTELQLSPFYEQVVRPLQIEHGMGCVFREGDWEAFLVTHRSAREGPFQPEAVERFQKLIPSLVRACRVNLCLAEARGSRREALSALHGLRIGVVLVEPDRRVRFANQSAVRAFDTCTALTVKNGHLIAGDRDETEDLERLIHTAIETRRAPRATAVRCPEHGEVIEIVVQPSRAPDASAVVLFRTPHEPANDLAKLLEQLYQLTPTEARVACAVMEGQGLKQSAQQLGIGVSTARTHLCRVFEKTGTRRQGELIRLLLEGPALIVGRD
jgi:DNA-binding CsgD family transcriptional regulator